MAAGNSERTVRRGRLAMPFVLSWLLLAGCTSPPPYGVVIRNGTVYDGSGGPPMLADLIAGCAMLRPKPTHAACGSSA